MRNRQTTGQIPVLISERMDGCMDAWVFLALPTLGYVIWAPEEKPGIGVTPFSFRLVIPRDLYLTHFHRQSRTPPAFLMQLGATAGQVVLPTAIGCISSVVL